jgi:SAM-dependent methyltransferase
MKQTLKRILPLLVQRAYRCVFPVGDLAMPGVSDSYEPIMPEQARALSAVLGAAWQDPNIPLLQLAIVLPQLAAFGRGEPVPVFDALVDLVRRVPEVGRKSCLEVGCSSGYYAEVLRLRGIETRYSGCDYSPALLELARSRYPGIEFDTCDATDLGYPDGAFDVVVSGGCLLHIFDYPRAIAEAARVAREVVIFHRTPVIHVHPTMFYRKLAYGVPCIEIHFNETELLDRFHAAGLRLAAIETVAVGAPHPVGDVEVMKSYLCIKE